MVEGVRENLRARGGAICQLNVGTFPEQDVDDSLGGAAGTDDEGVPFAHAQPERPQGDAESVHVRVVARGPAVSQDDRVHDSKSFRVAIEFVHGSDDRLLVRACHIEASDSKALSRDRKSTRLNSSHITISYA